MPLLKPYIDWPGVTNGIRSLIYTTGHGITPGHLEITINAQDDPPAMFGDLSFGDGVRNITLRNCMVVDIRDDYSTSGHYQHLTIQDRRWAWRYGSIPGQYNQLDDRGKLIPWTIRSPTELALLCLREMGESNFQIKLPTGLSSNDIPQINRLLITGENFPQSLANPETIWDGVAPAVGDVLVLPPGTLTTLVVSAANSGPYEVTSLGAAGSKVVLTRPANYQHGDTITSGTAIQVGGEGTSYANTRWIAKPATAA